MTVVDVRAVAWEEPVAVALREAMEAEMRLRYADRTDPAHGLPPGMSVTPSTVAYTGVAYNRQGLAVGHVALRWAGPGVLELKRMYVMPAYRGRGVAEPLLDAAECVAAELGAERIVLQTGDRQPDAVRMYQRNGYARTPVFPPYETIRHSRCFQKTVPARVVPWRPCP